MKALQVTKIAVRFVVGTGTNQIIRTIVANNVDPENIREKITVNAGAIAVSAMVADAAKNYTDAKVEAAFNFYETQIRPRLHK